VDVRYWSNRLHLWIGLIIGVPIVLLGLSGSVLVFRWSLDYQLNRNLYQLESKRANNEVLRWDRLLEVARSEAGDDPVRLLWNSPAGQGVVIAGTVGLRKIHLDPGRLGIIGNRGLDDCRSVVWWIQEFHTSFFLGKWGHTVVSATTAVCLISILTGFVLWLFPLSKSWMARFGIRSFTGFARFNWDFHNALGFYTFPVVMLIVLTGVLIGFWGTLGPVVYSITGSKPENFKSPKIEGKQRGYSIQRAVKSAGETWPAASLKRIVVPEDRNTAVRLRFQTPNEAYEPGLSWIWVNPYSGEVLKSYRPEDRSVGDSIYLWLFPLHFGGWGHVWGESAQLITRVFWLIGAMVPVILVITGVIIWWAPSLR